MAKFASLPDDCYYLIFARLPTTTLLSCRRVSRAWLRNQQQVCRNRKSLIILQGNSPEKLFTKSHFKGAFIAHGIDQKGQPMNFDQFRVHHQVSLRSFNRNVTLFLSKTFPNLNTLFIAHLEICSQDVIKPMVNLLQLFQSRVVTLKMYLDYRGELAIVINPNIRKVIRQLNSMTALEHVTLESHNPPGLSLKVNNNDLEFLTRIKQFYCYAPAITKSWHDALRRLEQNGNASKLEHIGLALNTWAYQLYRQAPFNWPLVDRFTHFLYYASSTTNMDNLPHFEQVIGQFRLLTSFTIHHDGRSVSRSLASKLTILSAHSLVHIKLYITNVSLFTLPFDPSTIKPLESVKALDLVISHDYYLTKINLQAQVTPLVHTFPNLVSIKIIRSRHEYANISKPTIDTECVNFLRQLKATFEPKPLRTVHDSLESCVNIYSN